MTVMAAPAFGERRAFSGGDAHLNLHQIEAGDRLGDWMLDLKPGVHLQEERFTGSSSRTNSTVPTES